MPAQDQTVARIDDADEWRVSSIEDVAHSWRVNLAEDASDGKWPDYLTAGRIQNRDAINLGLMTEAEATRDFYAYASELQGPGSLRHRLEED